MASQVVNGKAFEWACALSIADALEIPILETAEADVAKRAFESISQDLRDRFTNASLLGIEHILQREAKNPAVLHASVVRLAKDSSGQKGDVRDVVIFGLGGFELGVSCKTNHDDFKHPRLSGKLDFVRSWELDSAGCSDEYWTQIRPIFEELKTLKVSSHGRALWASLPDKHNDVYKPILKAFEKEVNRLTSQNAPTSTSASQALARYVIGTNDFYKLICRKDGIKLQAFNLNGTLTGKKTNLPEFMLGTDDLDGSKESITVRMNRGYAFNFRLHNASSRIEPSLKFAVGAIGLPPGEVYENHIEMNLRI